VPFLGEDVDCLVTTPQFTWMILAEATGTSSNFRQTICAGGALDVNLVAPTLLVKGHVPAMLRRSRGRLVNISSGMGRLLDADGASFAYRASKLALNCLTLSVAQHFAAASGDLAAFSFCPNWIRMGMGTDQAPGEAEPAAQAVVDLLQLAPELTNGRFFRHCRELGWDLTAPAPLGRRPQRS
jgi:NAD(P)-dependent dehydrogenase (short-subunit alcohol dehydrogenase family)